MKTEGIKAARGTDEKGNPIVELVDGEGRILLRLPMTDEGGTTLAKRGDERVAGKRFGSRFLRAKVVVLAVVLALTVGVSSMALGANGKPFILGKGNGATKVSTLTKSGAGPALSLRVGSGSPLAVNSAVRVPNLNADMVDGLDSTDFLPTNGKAADSELLDGLNSTDFLASGTAAGGDLVGNYPDPQITLNAVGTFEIENGGVTGSDIATGGVSGGPGGDLSDNTVTTDDIAQGGVGSDEVANGSLRLGDIAVDNSTRNLDFDSIAAGSCRAAAFGNFPQADVGDLPIVITPSGLDSRLVASSDPVGIDNNVGLTLCNLGNDAINPPSATFHFIVLRP